jgi:hypothetical protein
MVGLAMLVAACGGSGNSFTPGVPSGPSIPSIGGVYASPSMWHFDYTRVSDNQFSPLTCAGSLTVRNQTGNTFSGSFLIQDDSCGQVPGSVDGGTLAADGSVSFALGYTGGTNFILAAFGCTYVSGDTRLTGAIHGAQLDASSTTLMDCPNDGRVSLNIRASGSR